MEAVNMGGRIHYISHNAPRNKRVLLRVDFNVSLSKQKRISDDVRIREAVPTIKLLLENKNKVIIVSHLGRPEGRRNSAYSLGPVAKRLGEFLPKKYHVKLVEGFEDSRERKVFEQQDYDTVLMLENIRFWKGEQGGDVQFAQALASLADVYVNDAFGVSHRADASVVGVAKYLPSYGGLLLKHEIEEIDSIIDVPRAPIVSIIGGAKIETKVPVISKLIEFSDTIVVGGAIANTFLAACGTEVGKSLVESEEERIARKIMKLAEESGTELVLPQDVVVGTLEGDTGTVCDLSDVPKGMMILDIGPKTEALLGEIIAKARTIIWNGPMGYNENPQFARGTEFLFYSIANSSAKSLVGGGDTIVSISKEEHLDNITHISTGGGAMLEYIEHETLPGIEALKTGKK